MSNANFIIPSSIADRQAIRKAVKEACDAKTRIQSELDHIKDIKARVKEKYGIPGPVFGKMFVTEYNQSFETEMEKHSTFEEFYEAIMKSSGSEQSEVEIN